MGIAATAVAIFDWVHGPRTGWIAAQIRRFAVALPPASWLSGYIVGRLWHDMGERSLVGVSAIHATVGPVWATVMSLALMGMGWAGVGSIEPAQGEGGELIVSMASIQWGVLLLMLVGPVLLGVVGVTCGFQRATRAHQRRTQPRAPAAARAPALIRDDAWIPPSPTWRRVPRPIPGNIRTRLCIRWSLVVAVGLLPAGAVWLELMVGLRSVQLGQQYHAGVHLLMAVVCMMLTSGLGAVMATSALLHREDHDWQPVAWGGGVSAGVWLAVLSLMHAGSTWASSLNGQEGGQAAPELLPWGPHPRSIVLVLLVLLGCGIGLVSGAVGYVTSWLFLLRTYAKLQVGP